MFRDKVESLIFLHTSDWHLGQRLYGKSRDEEHDEFLSYLLDIIVKRHVDLLLVSGDIFDVGFPSNRALHTYYGFLNRLKSTCCKQVIITGGNHDYASTLNSSREILNYLQIYVFGGAPKCPEDCIVDIFKNDKLVAQVGAVPFLRDGDIRLSEEAETVQEKADAVRKGITNYYNAVGEAFNEKENLLKIMCGHLFMHGGSLTGSERDIQIGNLGGIHLKDLPTDVDYWALGHIHKPQIVGGNNAVRYSGSPIPMDFSEKKDPKSVVLGEWSGNSLDLEVLPVPQFRSLNFMRGTLADIKVTLENLASSLALQPWCEILVEEEEYSTELIMSFRELIQQKWQCEIIKSAIIFKNDPTTELSTENLSDPETMDPIEVFKNIISSHPKEEQQELVQLFEELRSWHDDYKQHQN